MLTITTARVDGIAMLTVAGELDIATGRELCETVEQVSGVRSIVVDCRHLQFCDSSGIEAFVQARITAGHNGATLHLSNVNGLVHRVMSVCGVLDTLTSPPSPDRKGLLLGER